MNGVAENYRFWLVQELAKRTRRNPAYSLRSFSKALGISAPSLSQIISGKRPLSRQAALKIIQKCNMAPEEARVFLSSALGSDWQDALKKIDPAFDGGEFAELEIETFRAIGSWHHYAIMSLGDIPNNQANPEWIASELGISKKEAKEAFERLEKLGMIALKGKGFYQATPPSFVSTRGYEGAFRAYHQQTLHKAEEALGLSDTLLEFFSGITMAIDESNLPKARKMIRDFQIRLCRTLEAGKRERVYTFSVQLFPLSKKKGKKNEIIQN
jgi:uncharacterized protein (TIGR02147 family)